MSFHPPEASQLSQPEVFPAIGYILDRTESGTNSLESLSLSLLSESLATYLRRSQHNGPTGLRSLTCQERRVCKGQTGCLLLLFGRVEGRARVPIEARQKDWLHDQTRLVACGCFWHLLFHLLQSRLAWSLQNANRNG